MDALRIRTYNVRFGDAILISVPDQDPAGHTEMRHILIDVGNVLRGEGGEDAVFGAILRDVQEVLDGKPLDLYVMTHEHMDHVQGLPYAAEKLGIELDVAHAWLTASAAKDYYDHHPEAKKQHLQLVEAYQSISSFLQAVPERETPWIQALMLNNNPNRTADCVDYLRELAAQTTYVYRGIDLAGTHPFHETQFQILAPEEDTSAYYGRFQPMALGVTMGEGRRPKPRPTRLIPPEGVDAGAFYNLVEARRHGFAENLLAIDKARNNTSVVFTLEWRGWRLLFSGDAEVRSWQTMDKHGALSPVHVLKVSHHASHNGTPQDSILDELLPPAAPDGKRRYALVSTFHGTYNNVPDEHTLERLSARAELVSSEGLDDGAPVDVKLTERDTQETEVAEELESTIEAPVIVTGATDEGGIEMSEEQIRVCIDRVLDPHTAIDAADRAVEENPANVPIFRPGRGVRPPTRLELAGVTGKLWQPGRTLQVAFMDGDSGVQAKVESFTKVWSQFANIKFDFGNHADPQIRISFKARGSWSYIGTDALVAPANEQTMNFGWLTPSSADNEYSRVVTHEFGHALGCIHEHQNPAANIPWDKEAVYRYYAGPPNFWSRQETDVNLFQKYAESLTQFSDFDPLSIMLYSIDNALTLGDFAVGWNRQLSPTDKAFIGVLYPFQVEPASLITVDGTPVEDSIGQHGETDWFQFVVTAKGRYRLETRGWTDVVMALLGPNNQTNVIGEDDDSGRRLNAKIEAELEPGTYYARVSHFRPTGTGKYEIMVNSM